LTSIHQVRTLTNEQARQQYPVRLRAVVTLNHPARWLMFVQDGTEAIYCSTAPERPFAATPGDLVEIEGVTQAGAFSPILAPASVRVLGHPGLPEPRRVTAEDLSEGRFENVLGELNGKVTALRYAPAGEAATTDILDILVGRLMIHANLPSGVLAGATDLLNAYVQLRGILGVDTNGKAQRRASSIKLSGLEAVTVLQRRRIEWGRTPSAPIKALAKYGQLHLPLGSSRRVRLFGVVTYFDGNRRWYLQDGDEALIVDAALPYRNRIGAALEALGDLEWTPSGDLHLVNALFRPSPPRSQVHPVSLVRSHEWGSLANQSSEWRLLKNQSRLVAVPGKLLDQAHLPGRDALTLVDDYGFVFGAELANPAQAMIIPRYAAGDTVQVIGVPELDWPSDFEHIRYARVLLRGPADVTLLARRPWRERIEWPKVALAGMALIGGVFLWVSSLRKRVKQQTLALARQGQALQAAVEAAQAANCTKSAFLANMSHEIRTPLNGVLGMTELALQASCSPEQREDLEVALASGRGLLNVLNDILDFSKIEAGKLAIEQVEFSLHELVQTTIRSVTTLASGKGISLRLQIDPKTPEIVRGDGHRLRQVLLNLITNGIKFTLQGEVLVSVGPEPAGETARGEIRFEVQDTGIGLSAEARDNLFQPFVQADGSTTRRFGGTGLGLAVSAQLVKLMDGRISVNSELGLGSTFWFTIPLPQSQPTAMMGQQPSAAAVRHTPTGGLPTLEVLLVEDNPVNQRVSERLIVKRGHRVSIACNGIEAVDFATRQHFDLALMDVQMPEMDGCQATQAIRRAEGATSRRLRILGLTANAMQGDRERCLEAGMDGYIPKPVSAETLWAALDQVAGEIAGQSVSERTLLT
jgi:signal transduction histidine kinase/ActR/RegA family two-component response regulator